MQLNNPDNGHGPRSTMYSRSPILSMNSRINAEAKDCIIIWPNMILLYI